jgi:hypothetical protein
MTSLLRDLFGVSQPVIAMLHLPALPGRPRHDRRAGDPAYRGADLVIPSLTALDGAALRRLGGPAGDPRPAADLPVRDGPEPDRTGWA